MIQLTREEVQRLIEALHADPLYADLDGSVSLLREKLAELAPKPMTDFDIRGKLSTLKCWHRMSGDEVQDLIEFFGGSSAAPKPMTDEEIDDALSDIWGSDTGETLSAHLQRKIARSIEARMNRV